MLVTLGVSLAKKGIVTACRTQRQMFRTSSGSFSNLVGETNKQQQQKEIHTAELNVQNKKQGNLKLAVCYGVCMRDRMRDREPEILSTVIEGLYKCELLLLEDSCFIRHLLACQSGCLEKGEAAQCLTCSHSAHFCSLLKHTTMSKSTTSKPTATQGWLLHTHSLKHISVSPPTHDQQHLIPIMQQSLNRLQFRTFQIEHNAEQCDLILARKRHTYWGLDVKTSYICRILHYQSNGMDTSHKGFLHLYHFLLLEKNNEDINTIK